MESKNCIQCNNIFVGQEDICDNCKISNGVAQEKMTKLEGAIEALAVLKSYKEIKK